jgi:hypothetical protein
MKEIHNGVADLLRLHSQVWKRLRRIPGVCGLGIGLSDDGRESHTDVGWRIYVDGPATPSGPDEACAIPREIAGFPTEVIRKQSSFACYGNSFEDKLKPGIQVTRKGTEGGGTLGCFARVVGQPNKIVLLSCSHVLYGPSAGADHKIGQPDVSCCCCHVIGKNRGDRKNNFNKVSVRVSHPSMPSDEIWDGSEIDCAAALVNNKRPFTNESEFYGMITGAPPAGTLGASAGDSVEKVGSETGHTKGKIVEFTTVSTYLSGGTGTVDPILFFKSLLSPDAASTGAQAMINQLVVIPDPDPANPSLPTDFGAPGDSGAVVINSATKQVIGMLNHVIGMSPRTRREFEPFMKTPPFPPHVGSLGIVSPIGPALASLGVEIVNNMFGTVTTSGPVLEVPPGVQRRREEVIALDATLRDLESEMRQKKLGQEILKKIAEHRPEVTARFHDTRAVMDAWRHGQGPTFSVHCVRSFKDHHYLIPSEVNGVTPVALAKKMARVFKTYGSDRLRSDIEDYESLVLEWIAGCNSVWQLVDRMRKLDSVAEVNEVEAVTVAED